MSSREPARQTRHVAVRIPKSSPGPDDRWTDETYRLLAAFRRECGAAIQDAPDCEAFIIAASDELWARFREEARWARFERSGLFTTFAQFVAVPGWAADCIATLKLFFAFLERTGVIDHESARRIEADLRRPLIVAHGAAGPNRSQRRYVARARRRAAAC